MYSVKGWWLYCFIAGVVLFACLYSANENPNALVLARSQATQQGANQSPIRVKVELVSTPVVVQNQKGELIHDLGPRDFRIFDNGVEQTLESFEIGGTPLAAAFVIETSSRVEALLPAISRTGLVITQDIIGETGEAALIGYSDQVVKLHGFTNDHSAIEKTMANLQSESSDAHLYDALWQAVGMLQYTPQSRRRVIVTIAEDIDTGSKEDLSAIVREAQIDGIAIYAVSLSSFQAGWRGPEKQAAAPSVTPSGIFALPPIPGSMYTPGMEQLRRGNMDLGAFGEHTLTFSAPPMGDAAAATGGLYQSTFADDSIERAIDRIAGELTFQYTLSYRPNTNQTKGDFHKIKVVVVSKGKLRVRSRPGYYVSPSQ
jgi:VWFA-related protein